MISIFIANLGRYNEGYMVGEWVVLPCSQEKLEQTLHNIGINKVYEEWFIADRSSQLQCVCAVICEIGSIAALNELAKRLEELTPPDLEKLEAIHEAEEFTEVSQVLNTSYQLDTWTVYDGVESQKDLGEYFYHEMSALEIPEPLVPYFDFGAYGRDIHLGGTGTFTTYGYVTRD